MISLLISVLILLQQNVVSTVASSNAAASTPVVPAQSDNYVLGPGDQILIRALDLDELDNA